MEIAFSMFGGSLFPNETPSSAKRNSSVTRQTIPDHRQKSFSRYPLPGIHNNGNNCCFIALLQMIISNGDLSRIYLGLAQFLKQGTSIDQECGRALEESLTQLSIAYARGDYSCDISIQDVRRAFEILFPGELGRDNAHDVSELLTLLINKYDDCRMQGQPLSIDDRMQMVSLTFFRFMKWGDLFDSASYEIGEDKGTFYEAFQERCSFIQLNCTKEGASLSQLFHEDMCHKEVGVPERTFMLRGRTAYFVPHSVRKQLGKVPSNHLLFVLNRMEHNQIPTKSLTPIKVEPTLSLFRKEVSQFEANQFQLKGFVLHKGASGSMGHYVTVKKEMGLGGKEVWVSFNDNRVQEIESHTKIKRWLSHYSHILLYTRVY